MMSLEWHGDEVLKRMKNSFDQAMGDVKLTDLMHPAFVQKHTKFDSLKSMFEASQLMSDDSKAKEMAVILKSQEWDRFVAANSDFASWNEMIKDAATARVKAAFNK
jgi:hypothetical protein